MKSIKQGFTLIELSIVLVIIGLLVGGVLVGRDLIHAAEIRKTISQIESYNTATLTFRNKYNGLPGDIKNATDFWGVANADPVACAELETDTGAATCNGDGDELIPAMLASRVRV